MPSPPEEFRVHPDYQVLATLAERIASSLSTVLLLGTYGLLSFDHWSKLIPLYMDAIGNLNANADEQKGLGTFQESTNEIDKLTEYFKLRRPFFETDLEEILCKLLENELSAIAFDTDQTWSFATQVDFRFTVLQIYCTITPVPNLSRINERQIWNCVWNVFILLLGSKFRFRFVYWRNLQNLFLKGKLDQSMIRILGKDKITV